MRRASGTGVPQIAAAAGALVVLAVSLSLARTSSFEPPERPNILLVVTDDQTFDTLPSDPPSMPWLQSQFADPSSGWLRFPDAVVSTPLCCPSRATILTGLDDRHTGVTDNHAGDNLNESDTIPVWLHDAGYRTALVGKYLNEYPWDRGPYVPPGWDRWVAKTNESPATTYYNYRLVDQGRWWQAGDVAGDYVTDVLRERALEFLRTAPASQPWFLMFTPPAPHEPWIPAPRDRTLLDAPAPSAPSDAVLNDVAGKPMWVRRLPPVLRDRLAGLQQDRVAERATLAAVDRSMHALLDAVEARGDLDRTVIVFLSDNGYQFGEHRWQGKEAPYEGSIRVPFAIRSPWTASATVPELVGNVDVAPTIAALAGVSPPGPVDGRSLAPIVRGDASTIERRTGMFLDWAGGDVVPPWSGIRTQRDVFVRYADGDEELYDLRADPDELRNLAADPAAAELRRRMASLLARSLARAKTGG
jgi:N-acetylglucosamine-6-sulfatase